MLKKQKILPSQFTYEGISRYSKAAAALCLWVLAVHKYAGLRLSLEPEMKEIKQLEKTLQEVCVSVPALVAVFLVLSHSLY